MRADPAGSPVACPRSTTRCWRARPCVTEVTERSTGGPSSSAPMRGRSDLMTQGVSSMLRARRWRFGVVTAVLALVLAATATAGFIGLPSDGSQVNNDPANGIDPARDAGLSDVVG